MSGSFITHCENFDYLSFNNESSKYFSKIHNILSKYDEVNSEAEMLNKKIFTEYIYKRNVDNINEKAQK